MRKQVLIAGGGIGGLAAALGAEHAGWDVRLFERAPAFAEVGAGVQLGPNVVRRLQAWGLQKPLQAVASFPSQLVVRSAVTGEKISALRLGASMVERYGAAYATIHRADLHQLLLSAAQVDVDLHLNLGLGVNSYTEEEGVVTITTSKGKLVEGDALIGADGLWSQVRQQMLADGLPKVSNHLAYRALLPQHELPESLRCENVTVWMGKRLHVVQYPVRGGALQNLVVIVHGTPPQDLQNWDHGANAADLESALAGSSTRLQDVVRSVAGSGHGWRLWSLCGRIPVSSDVQMAQGLVALLGDAAHPMLPYLAQGAGMAIEDAAELQRSLAMHDMDVPLRLRRYALNRWQRNARVQARAQRNGHIFHATGVVQWGRDLSLRLLGERLLDLPWLYRGDGSGASVF